MTIKEKLYAAFLVVVFAGTFYICNGGIEVICTALGIK